MLRSFHKNLFKPARILPKLYSSTGKRKAKIIQSPIDNSEKEKSGEYLFDIQQRLKSNFFPKEEETSKDDSLPGKEMLINPKFADFGLPKWLTEALDKKGITEPSVVQAESIPYIMGERDILIRCQTGSGKSFGILVAILAMKPKCNYPRVNRLWVVPHADLGEQVFQWTSELLEMSPDEPDLYFRANLFTGPLQNEDYIFQFEENRKKVIPEILIATPKRVIELIQSEVFDLSKVETVVLDEADTLLQPLEGKVTQRHIENWNKHPPPCFKMLEMLNELWKKARHKPTLVACSATLTAETQRMLMEMEWINRSLFVGVGEPLTPPVQLEHYVLEDCLKSSVPEDFIEQCPLFVQKIFDEFNTDRAIVMVSQQFSASKVLKELMRSGLDAAFISDKKRLRSDPKIFVSSESIRGIDLPGYNLVIFIGTCSNVANYLHCCGRVARMDQPGVCVICPSDVQSFGEIQGPLTEKHQVTFQYLSLLGASSMEDLFEV